MGDATLRAIGDWLTVWPVGAIGSNEIFVILDFATSGTQITGNFIKNYLEIMTDSIATQLKQASKGLLFLSETDAPFELINWPAQGELTPGKLLQLTGHPPEAPVEMRTVDDFFAVATKEEDWHDEEERETVKRFQNLVSTLKQNLSQLQVYRVDSIDIDAYIVGVTDGGELAGLSTKLVET